MNVTSERLLIALVTKIRSPQTIGLECASPGTATFQRRFVPVAPFHSSGSFWPSAMPEAEGPRKPGQLSSAAERRACPSWARDKARTMAASFRALGMGNSAETDPRIIYGQRRYGLAIRPRSSEVREVLGCLRDLFPVGPQAPAPVHITNARGAPPPLARAAGAEPGTAG